MRLRSGVAVAVVQAGTAASIPLLSWEFPYALGAVLKKQTKETETNNTLKMSKEEFPSWLSG